MITHNFTIDVVTEGVPTNTTPNTPPLPSGAYSLSLQKSEGFTTAGGLLPISTNIYQPSQIRIINSTNGSIWWTVVAEEEYNSMLDSHSDLFHFFEINAFESRSNTSEFGLSYLLIYLGTATTGNISVEGYNYRLHRINPPTP